MQTPWFMHCHNGRNTLVGVYGARYGTYVRSYVDSEVQVTFYPIEPLTRSIIRIGLFQTKDDPHVEAKIDEAVATHLAAIDQNVSFREAIARWVDA